MMGKRREWFRPRVFLSLFVCLSVLCCWLLCTFARLRVCVFVCSFVCGVAWGGLCEGLFWLRGEASCHSSGATWSARLPATLSLAATLSGGALKSILKRPRGAPKRNWKRLAALAEDDAEDSSSKGLNRRVEQKVCDMSMLNWILASSPGQARDANSSVFAFSSACFVCLSINAQ